jgi:hypothetical protein
MRKMPIHASLRGDKTPAPIPRFAATAALSPAILAPFANPAPIFCLAWLFP